MEKSKVIKSATNKKNKKINELLKIKEQMINNNIGEKIIQKFIDDEYLIINTVYEKSINKKNDTKKEMNKKRNKAIEFLLKNKNFLEQNNADIDYIKEYVKKQYEDINKTYSLNENDTIGFIDIDQ